MIINHNIVAQNAVRQFGINRINSSKSIEKLSSGLRINRAGDDAAGLAISEKMRAQIRGLNQAARNAQDGISLVQTAEGALTETQSMIQRMRELANQAANGTNTISDREAIQSEINELTAEVNRVGNSTEFNTIPLLKSGNSLEALPQNIIDGLKEKGWLELAEKRISDAFDIVGKNNAKIKLELKEKIDGAVAYVSYNSANTDLILAIDLKDFNPATGESGDTSAGFYADQILAHEMTHGIMADSLGFDKMASLPTWFKEGTAEFIPGADNRLKSHITTGGSLDPAKKDDLIDRAFDLINGAGWNSDSLDYAAGYLATKYLDSKANENGSDFKEIFNTIEASTLFGQALVEDSIVQNTAFSDMASFAADFKTNASSYIDSLELNYSGKDLDTGSIMGVDHKGKSSGTALDDENVIDNSSAMDKDGQPLENFTMEWGVKENSYIELQIGANSGQRFSLEMEDMRSNALMISGSGDIMYDGTKASYASGDKNKLQEPSNEGEAEYALDVTSYEKASAALDIYDKALSKVSSFRSRLGAYQNRLEHTINNLNSTAENLQAAESRIRDADMAKEMMEFTKNNILQQASQAMLAQANQLSQGVLQLLR